MVKCENITGGCAAQGIKQELSHRYIRLFGERYGYEGYKFIPITKVYLIPEITMPYNKLYMLVAFDYLPERDNRQIFKCSEQYNTSHFKEKISLN